MKIGWRTLTPEEAFDLDLEQVARVTWRVFVIEAFGYGITILAEPIGSIE